MILLLLWRFKFIILGLFVLFVLFLMLLLLLWFVDVILILLNDFLVLFYYIVGINYANYDILFLLLLLGLLLGLIKLWYVFLLLLLNKTLLL